MQTSFEDQGAGASGEVLLTATELPSARFVWFLRLICTVALGISVYLAWTAFSIGEVFGCSGGDVFDCGHVLTSHWSKVIGIPVSIPAAGVYASLLALLAFARSSGPQQLRQMVWGGMTIGGVMAGLSALWFIALQVFVVEHLCSYCLVVHSCGILLAAVVLSSRLCPRTLKLKSAAVSVLGVSALIGIQVATPKADQFEIVRYDELTPTTPAAAAIATNKNGAEEFTAPGDVFEPPGEAFEPPVEVFEAPLADDGSAGSLETETPTARNGTDTKEAKPSDTKPAVASSLLFILPTRILRLVELLCAGIQPPESATVQEQASDAKPANESASSDKPAEPEAAKTPERRLLAFAGNRFTLDVKQWPLLGKPDAKYVFVEMYDYTCPHCRNTHQAITGAMKQYGDNLAILALPVPLDANCNPTVNSTGGGHAEACELARIAVAVWRIDPAKFREFHDWMFAGTRSAFAARQHAETLVDKDKLKKELSSDIPSQYISRHVKLYERVGSGQVPKLIFPAVTLNGEVNSSASLCSTIERELSAAKQ
ncbi:MAG TPA: vitamin K epoxide reductase family protein [Planctomycetaceae bacterium]|nr:vitamin K epoxide reductase family protein [Planctomycetaceae bacterium]